MSVKLDRAERRRLLKKDSRWIGKPMALNAGRHPFEANVRHIVSILRDAGLPHRAAEAAAYTQRLFDLTIKSLKPAKMACAKGCYYCCHTFVTAVPPEVFRVARVLRERGGDVKARIDATHDKSSTIPQKEKWKALIPCPLLEAEICSVHSVRPLSCRGCVSASAEACYRIYMEGKEEVPPFAMEYNSVTTAAATVLAAALKLVGLPYRTLDWNGALAAAMSSPDTEERWLAGEDIFEGVTRGIGTDPGTPFDNMVRELVQNVAPTI